MTEWEVQCEKCGHTFNTKAITPNCSKCHCRRVKWIRAVQK